MIPISIDLEPDGLPVREMSFLGVCKKFLILLIFLFLPFGWPKFLLGANALRPTTRGSKNLALLSKSLQKVIIDSNEETFIMAWEGGFTAKVKLHGLSESDETDSGLPEFDFSFKEFLSPEKPILKPTPAEELIGIKISVLFPPKEIRTLDNKLLWKGQLGRIKSFKYTEKLLYCKTVFMPDDSVEKIVKNIEDLFNVMSLSDKFGWSGPPGRITSILKRLLPQIDSVILLIKERPKNAKEILIEKLKNLIKEAGHLKVKFKNKKDPGFGFLVFHFKRLQEKIKKGIFD
jgi:hypothetical protein